MLDGVAESAARFPGLALAYEALRGPEGTAVVLNAANEVAVAAFLDHQVPFTAIHAINLRTLERMAGRFAVPGGLDDLLDIDGRARAVAAAAAREAAR